MVTKLETGVKIVGYVSYLTFRVTLGYILSLGLDVLATLVPDEDVYPYIKYS